MERRKWQGTAKIFRVGAAKIVFLGGLAKFVPIFLHKMQDDKLPKLPNF